MKMIVQNMPFIILVDGAHARMMAYARSAEGRAKIAKAQSEIDAGLGIVADRSYFENLKKRRDQKRAMRPQ